MQAYHKTSFTILLIIGESA